jgi:hypothetical protein
MTAVKEAVERAKRSGRPLLWMAGLAGLFIGVLAGWYARDFMAVNACLDAGGGWIKPGVCVGAPPPVR